MDKDNVNNQDPNVAQDDSLVVEDQPTNKPQTPPQESQSNDDEAVQAAASNLSEQEAQASTPPPKPKRSKKPLVIVLLLLVVVAIAAAGWWYYQQQQTEEPAISQETTEEAEVVPSYEPNTVAYAFRQSEDVPFALFWRSAAGGERTEVQKLNSKEVVQNYDVSGANIAFNTQDSIFVSTDSGASYTEIISLKAGEQVTSVKFNKDASKLGVALLPDIGGKNKVTSYDLNGENPETIFTSDKSAVHLEGWDASIVIFSEGCYNCDGPSVPFTYNTSSKEFTEIKASDAADGVTTITASADLSKVIIVNAPEATGGLGTAPPYQIELMDVASGEKTLLTSIGQADEENPNGTEKTYTILTGFLAGTNDPYYTSDKQLYTVTGSEPSLVYESSKQNIVVAPYVSKDTLIIGIGDNNGEYVLSNYNVQNDELTNIYNGDANTTLLGVTTK